MSYLMPTRQRPALNLDISQIPPGAPFDPVTVDEVKTTLMIQHSQDDTELLRLIKIATGHIEGRLGMGLIEQSWSQVQDYAAASYILHRRPVLSLTSVSYLADDSSTLWTTLDPAFYYLATRRVIARAAYPSIRNCGGWKTIFKIGYAVLPGTVDDAAKIAARAAIPSDIVGAIIAYVGHLYENKEGQGSEAKYEVAAKSYGALPPNITLLLERHLNWRVGG